MQVFPRFNPDVISGGDFALRENQLPFVALLFFLSSAVILSFTVGIHSIIFPPLWHIKTAVLI